MVNKDHGGAGIGPAEGRIAGGIATRLDQDAVAIGVLAIRQGVEYGEADEVGPRLCVYVAGILARGPAAISETPGIAWAGIGLAGVREVEDPRRTLAVGEEGLATAEGNLDRLAGGACAAVRRHDGQASRELTAGGVDMRWILLGAGRAVAEVPEPGIGRVGDGGAAVHEGGRIAVLAVGEGRVAGRPASHYQDRVAIGVLAIRQGVEYGEADGVGPRLCVDVAGILARGSAAISETPGIAWSGIALAGVREVEDPRRTLAVGE